MAGVPRHEKVCQDSSFCTGALAAAIDYPGLLGPTLPPPGPGASAVPPSQMYRAPDLVMHAQHVRCAVMLLQGSGCSLTAQQHAKLAAAAATSLKDGDPVMVSLLTPLSVIGWIGLGM